MNQEERRSPEDFLRQIQAEEVRTRRKKMGKLTIFLGYAAGVGKTYAMLEAARQDQKKGIDIVAGYIEPHERPDTKAMAEGLERLPPLWVEYKGIQLRELDLDAVLLRHPKIVLVDELAHTNAGGMRHPKRYEDIEEILRAGIDVYTTVNIQHLESLHDVVSSISGISVKERFPDRVFDQADYVKLIDMEPDNLVERLKAGKIYRSQQAERALNHFFAREKLTALRELTLRRMADRVNLLALREKELYQNKDSYTGEHILTCISPSPACEGVIRSASRMACAFRAKFTALYVETPAIQKADPSTKQRLEKNLHLAEVLGAKVATVFGEDVAVQIAQYARVSSVTKVVLGQTNHRILFGQKKGTLADQILPLIPKTDLYIIPDNRGEGRKKYICLRSRQKSVRDIREKKGWETSVGMDVAKMLFFLCAATAGGFGLRALGFMQENVILLYMMAILLVSMSTGKRLISVLAALSSVLLFDIFFIPPLFRFGVNYTGYLLTFFCMFVFAILISGIIFKQRRQARESTKLAYRTGLLLENSQRMRRVLSVKELSEELSHQILMLLNLSVVVYLKNNEKLAGPYLFPRKGMTREELQDMGLEKERSIVQWVFFNKKRAGCCTHSLPDAKALYLPVKTEEDVFAVIGILLEEKREIPPFEYGLLTAMLNEAAIVYARLSLMEQLAGESTQTGGEEKG